MIAIPSPVFGLGQPPLCRLDNSYNGIVRDTLKRAIEAYAAIGKPLPIDGIDVNPLKPSAQAKALTVFIVQDASKDGINAGGCKTRPLEKSAPLDETSVRGGCIVVAIDQMEIRCSSDAVAIFSSVTNKPDRASPALLYVLSHELAHLYQRRLGEYAGRTEKIDLSWERATKLEALQGACDPVMTRHEEEADAIALEILAQRLSTPPYREPVFSERGSLYWNIDLLALASDAWQKASIEREIASAPRLHPAFEPKDFPTPSKAIEATARKFVCEVMTRRRGILLYPGKSISHPPIEQRLRHIAEKLAPIAARLPTTGAQEEFQPIAKLQQNVSPILTQIYRETGAYLEALQTSICAKVNAMGPQTGCR